MDFTMDRKRQTLNLLRIAVVGVLVAASCTGCGKPMLYHFKHYQRPFAAISKSNQTYFHSSQTGKIIEKDPCANYCEPGCYGYEETCWTPWPAECAGNCPSVQADPVMEYGAPYEGQVLTDGAMTVDQSVLPPAPVYQEAPAPDGLAPVDAEVPDAPAPSEGTRLPALRVPSLPADIESAVPSPSDSTMLPEAPSHDMHWSPAEETVFEPAKSIATLPVPARQPQKAPTVTEPKSPLTTPSVTASTDTKFVENELTPLPATKVARLPKKVKPILKSATKSSEQPKASSPVASSRKAKTLTEKRRVRATKPTKPTKPTKSVVTDTAAAKLPTQKAPVRLQLGGDNIEIQNADQVQPKQGLNTAQVVLPKAKESVVRFSGSDLATKLKKTKSTAVIGTEPTKVEAAKRLKAVKVQPKSAAPTTSEEKSVVKVKAPKSTLNVSTGESSIVRFANAKARNGASRLSAPQGSTVLRFTTDRYAF